MGDSIDLRNFPFCRASKLWGSVLSVNSNGSGRISSQFIILTQYVRIWLRSFPDDFHEKYQKIKPESWGTDFPASYLSRAEISG